MSAAEGSGRESRGGRDAPASQLPEANIKRRWRGWSIFWLIPIAALGMAAWLIGRQVISSGHEIRIRFEDASGLVPGKSNLRFRGVDVGTVREVAVTEDWRHSVVTATLEEEYKLLAREGTEFWVVRPQISGQGVRGLDTLISQNYIKMRVGRGEKLQTEFQGLEQAPVTRERAEIPEGLQIKLLAPQQWGLSQGAGVYYRGIQVGTVTSVELEPDSTAVRFEVLIREGFAPLVRLDSRFWKSGGLDVSAGIFRGLNVEVDDLRALLEGGVTFATPDEPGEPASQGMVFRLYKEGEPEWQAWRPKIPIEPGAGGPPPDAREQQERP